MTDFNMFLKKNKGYFVVAGVVFGFIMILTYVCCCIKFINHFFGESKKEDYRVIAQATLPRAEFFDIYADSESIVICEESENFLNQISTSDIALQMVEAEELARSDAYEDRVLDDAEDRTEKLLVEAVKAVYPDEDIEVKVLWNSIE